MFKRTFLLAFIGRIPISTRSSGRRSGPFLTHAGANDLVVSRPRSTRCHSPSAPSTLCAADASLSPTPRASCH